MVKALNVEVFSDNKFCYCFPAFSIKDILLSISKDEGVERLSDLKKAYLIYQQSDKGSYKETGGTERYHKVCSINATGKERSKFFEKITVGC